MNKKAETKDAQKITILDSVELTSESGLDKVESEVDKKVKKKGNSIFGKFKFGCILIFLLISSVCCGSLTFLWFGGYVQEWGCDVSKEDSQISKTLECKSNGSTDQGEGEFKYKEVVRDGEINISDSEVLITDVVENSSPSVVSIGVFGDQFSEDSIIGTGFIVSENGLIVTNQHVVSGGDINNFFVLVNEGDQLPVQEIYRDSINDIALVKVDATDLPALTLGNSDDLKAGQSVIAIGNPLGDLTGTVTTGIISALDRDVQVGEGFFNTSIGTFEGVIQTDAAINPGNSGGPLINLNGDVIGINFATIQGADNLSFAIPINRVKLRIEELNEFGKFRIPFLGVEYRRRVVFYENDSIIGALVTKVTDNGPAAKGSIVVGDIIVQYDGKSLEDDTLMNLIQRSEIGKEVEIIVLRDEVQRSLKVTVGER